MKKCLFLVPFVLMLTVPVRAQTASAPDSAAQAATDAWLALIDSSAYDQSWEDAAPMFQDAVPRDQWAQAAAQARGPLGTLQERTLINSQTMNELPNLPPGNYMVLEYNSRFAQMPRAVETHVLIQGDDEVWRTVGYFVRPAQ